LLPLNVTITSFNPRPRVGGYLREQKTTNFQPRSFNPRPRVGGYSPTQKIIKTIVSFNPRPRVGGYVIVWE